MDASMAPRTSAITPLRGDVISSLYRNARGRRMHELDIISNGRSVRLDKRRRDAIITRRRITLQQYRSASRTQRTGRIREYARAYMAARRVKASQRLYCYCKQTRSSVAALLPAASISNCCNTIAHAAEGKSRSHLKNARGIIVRRGLTYRKHGANAPMLALPLAAPVSSNVWRHASWAESPGDIEHKFEKRIGPPIAHDI